jgi:hypothetical protein
LALRKSHPNTKLDISSYKFYKQWNYQLEKVFKLNNPIYSTINWNNFFVIKIRSILNLNIEKEDTLYHPEVFNIKKSAYYMGYWNSEYYFQNVKEEVKHSFQFFEFEDCKNKELQLLITKTNSVSVHIRRGDYLINETNKGIYGNICTLQYYYNCIKWINKHVNNPKYFIFSDDLPWCKENLYIEGAIYIDWNNGVNNHMDMHLMSLCKHNILANSSFSWWSGWLNNNPRKIVLIPPFFFNPLIKFNMDTLVPNDWIRISNESPND